MENQSITKAIIYGLHDPRNGELRYIGKTKNDTIKARLLDHLATSRTQQHHRACWIRSLTKLNLKPELKVIEETSLDNWQERERFWINFYRENGANLTNSTEGGDGGATMRGRTLTKERCEAISKSLKGHPVSEKSRQTFIARYAVKGQTARNKQSFDDTRLLELYLGEKKSTRAIAKILGASQRPVLRRLHELGLSNEIAERAKQGTKGISKLRPDDIAKIIELLNQGVSQRKIALRFNVSPGTIKRHRAAARMVRIYLELPQPISEIVNNCSQNEVPYLPNTREAVRVEKYGSVRLPVYA